MREREEERGEGGKKWAKGGGKTQACLLFRRADQWGEQRELSIVSYVFISLCALCRSALPWESEMPTGVRRWKREGEGGRMPLGGSP